MSTTPSTNLLTVEVEQLDPATIAHLIGSANMITATELREQLLELVERRPRRLILDLSRLEFISSVGLGAIIAAHLRSRHHSGSIELAGPPGEIRELLELTKLTKVFAVHDSVAAALACPPA